MRCGSHPGLTPGWFYFYISKSIQDGHLTFVSVSADFNIIIIILIRMDLGQTMNGLLCRIV